MNNLCKKLMLGGSTAAFVAIASYGGALAQPQSANAAAGTGSTDVETVTVTGTSIRGVAPVGSNLVTVDVKAIEATGAMNAEELLNTVPAISTTGSAPQAENGNSYYTPQIHQLDVYKRQFAHMLFAIGVIDVLAGGKNFNRLGSAANQGIKQAGVQALFHIHVGRHRPLH